MARRRVQYGIVNASDADVGAGAPGFRASWQSKEDLRKQLMQISDVPKNGRLYFWDGQLWLRWDDPDDLPGPEVDPLRIKVVCPHDAASSDDLKQVMEALLEPINKICLEKLSQTRCASNMNRDDLLDVRKAFRTILQVKDAESDAFVKEEEFWDGRYEVEKAAEYLKTINTWAQVRRGLTFRDARGHVLREADTPLKFPISGSNDVVLALGQYVRELELGAFMGIEMKKGLTAKGLRQAEVEYYLWAGCSMFPFVQIITDMRGGGAAFYRTGSSPAGNNIVMQHLHGMDSVRDFVKNVVASIPDDAGEDDANGMLNIPHSLENPSRKRHREDTPEPGNSAGAGSFQRGHMSGYQRGYELIVAMQPEAGNELLGDLDDFFVDSWTNDEGRNVHPRVMTGCSVR